MWSCEAGTRRFVLGLALATTGLAGCNLRPMFGTEKDPELAARLASIEVKTPDSEIAQLLRNDLEDALNPSGLKVQPAYELAVQLDQYENAVLIQLDSTTTRYDLVLLASFALTERGAKEPFYSSAARLTASYNVVRQPFATRAARRDAERRGIAELSHEIRTRLALKLSGRPTPS